ncbi:MAG TPA: hypothetical protein VKA48_04625, partial [Gammaproteobacteria bacterium]|nr:hypothetical protein [Gammaproteobacteria bacterium]
MRPGENTGLHGPATLDSGLTGTGRVPRSIGLRGLTTLASPGKKLGRLTILIYHRVLPRKDPVMPTFPDTAEFDWQMGLLADEFRPLPLAEGVRRLVRG